MKKLIILILLLSSCSSSKDISPEAPPSASAIIVIESDAENEVANITSRHAVRLQRVLRDVNINLNPLVYNSPRIDCFVIGDQLRITSGLMDIMRNDELVSIIVKEHAHNKFAHYSPRLGNQKEIILNTRFTKAEDTRADAFALQYFVDNSLSPQSVVNSTYKFLKVYEKNTTGAQNIEYSPRLINSSTRERARSIAAMLEEYKLDRSYFSSIINSDRPANVVRSTNVDPAPSRVVNHTPIQKIVSSNRTVNTPVPVVAITPINAFEDNAVPEIIKTVKSKSASLSFKKPAPSVDVAPLGKSHKVERNKEDNQFKVTPGWYLQVSAEETLKDAKERIALLEKENLNCVIQDITTRGSTFYRILIGPYSNELTAGSKAGQSSLIKADAFTRYLE